MSAVPEPDSCTAAYISKLSTIASAGGSKRSPESGSNQPRQDRAADHRRGVGFKLLPSPTGSAIPSANQLHGYGMEELVRPPSTTEPLRMLRDTSCLSFCARPALHGVCASLTSLLVRGFRLRRPKADIEAPSSNVRFTPRKRTSLSAVAMSALCLGSHQREPHRRQSIDQPDQHAIDDRSDYSEHARLEH